MRTRSVSHGFGLIEVVIASAIVSMTVVALGYVFVLSTRLNDKTIERARANFLAQEGLEVVRYLRDSSWTTKIQPLATSTDYYVVFSATSSQWYPTTMAQPAIDNTFTRIIRLFDVSRDASDNIVTSGGTVDVDSRKVTVFVSWAGGSSISASTYITNMFAN